MNEEFDNKLKVRITELFDNYEDDSADEGWLMLRERFPEKEKRKPIAWLWWGSIAAVVFIISGIVLWMNSDNQHANTVAKNTKQIQHTSASTSLTPQHSNHDSIIRVKQNVVPVYEDSPSLYKAITASKQSGKNSSKSIINYSHHFQVTASVSTSRQRNRVLNELSEQVNMARSRLTETFTTENEKVKKTAKETTISETDATTKILTANVIDNSKPTAITDTGAKKMAVVIPKPKIEPKKPLFTAQNPTENRIENKADKRVKFGVYAATYFNYAKGIDNEFNVGAGISTEIRLTTHLKLVTGLAVTQNSLNYNSGIPQTAATYLAYSLANQPLYGSSVTGSSSTGNALSSPLTVQDYRASLIGLDIPVNLKYQFNDRETYISAGVSSGTYVNESYRFAYYYPAAGVNSTSLNNTTQNSFNKFDLARTLNLSIGKGIKLNKKNQLIIEPFLKYPLNGLGSQQIKFGSGGINLRFNFAPIKK